MGQLRKLGITTVTPGTPGTPGVPGSSPVGFRLWGVPPPVGNGYAAFTESQFIPIANAVGMSLPVPPWQIVYGPPDPITGDKTVTGFLKPGGELDINRDNFPSWNWLGQGAQLTYQYPLPSFIRPIIFPGVPTLDYGYPNPPESIGPIDGYFDIPKVGGGTERIWRQYVRTNFQVPAILPEGQRAQRLCWRPINYTDPPNVTTFYNGGVLPLVRLQDFPGSPGTPGTPGTPAVYDLDPRIGWNAGADSIERLDGDVFTEFGVSIVAAAVVGLTRSSAPEASVGQRDRTTHAFYFDRDAQGVLRYRIHELGRTRAGPFLAPDEGRYRIERVDGRVRYLVDDQQVFQSPLRSSGELMVTASLYRADDVVGREAPPLEEQPS